ncbi:MAG: PilC/PilY family type IV pilus protein, partial [Persephonella sp.]|nr:PilC/PilY family type IV pilus protein [Persephonella sp.]
MWGFIPKNALPYLRYLADPDYCHIYIHDLSPYIIKIDYNNDSNEEVILIGGMRLGGGCGCSSTTDCVNPPSDVCSDPTLNNCIGRSSYYALDITDPENPKFLWEFSHKDLGFSFSGPAYIKRFDSSANLKHFVLFASGPTSRNGYSAQSLKIFVLDLVTGNLLLEKDFPDLNNAFGGKLFTDGLDVNEDGQTDYVFLGYTKKTGSATAHGGLIKIWTGDSDPNNWDFNSAMLNFANNPVTARVETGKCFNVWYLFFGTGRYFYKEDDDQNINALYGVPFLCDANNNCPTGTINPVHSATVNLACGNIGDPTQGAWMIELDNSTDILLKERNISSPSFIKNIVFFATTQPNKDLCGYGGYSRAWAMNCATGDAVSSDRCPGYTINIEKIKYLLQLSGGNIEQFDQSSFTEEGG